SQTSGQTVQGPSLSRVPGGGVLSGTIVDETGVPLPDMTVILMRTLSFAGRDEVSSAGSERTGEDGAFRFTELPAGRYYLATRLESAAPAPGGTGTPESGRRVVTFFHPGTV